MLTTKVARTTILRGVLRRTQNLTQNRYNRLGASAAGLFNMTQGRKTHAKSMFAVGWPTRDNAVDIPVHCTRRRVMQNRCFLVGYGIQLTILNVMLGGLLARGSIGNYWFAWVLRLPTRLQADLQVNPKCHKTFTKSMFSFWLWFRFSYCRITCAVTRPTARSETYWFAWVLRPPARRQGNPPVREK